jgi:NLR family CARD domain-containing protein 3
MRLQNLQLEQQGQTPLILEELIAGRAYIGPMYEKYNAVLRFSAAKSPDGTVCVEYTSADDPPTSFLQKKCG